MRYAVGCKPREAVLYPDTVAGVGDPVYDPLHPVPVRRVLATPQQS